MENDAELKLLKEFDCSKPDEDSQRHARKRKRDTEENDDCDCGDDGNVGRNKKSRGEEMISEPAVAVSSAADVTRDAHQSTADTDEVAPVIDDVEAEETLPLSTGRDGELDATWRYLSPVHRVGCSYLGIPIDVLKSVLQKGVRRNRETQALLALQEWLLVVPASWNGKFKERFPRVVTAAKTAVTNALTRLCVMSVEDVGIANPDVVCAVLRVLLPMRAARTKRGGLVTEAAFATHVSKMAACVAALSRASKTRVMSHMWAAYTTPRGREYGAQRGMSWDVRDAERFFVESAQPKRVLLAPQDDALLRDTAVVDGDGTESASERAALSHELWMIVTKFATALATRNEAAAVTAWHAFERVASSHTWNEERVADAQFWDKAMPKATRAAVAVMWRQLKPYVDRRLLAVLELGYAAINERRPFAMMAIAMALLRPRYAVGATDVDGIARTLAATRWLMGPFDAAANKRLTPEVARALAPEQLVVRRWHVDLHTQLGRQRGMGTREYATTGAVVVPEEWRNDALFGAYSYSKGVDVNAF